MRKIDRTVTALALISALALTGCESITNEPIGFEADALIGVAILPPCGSCCYVLEASLFNGGLPEAGFKAQVSLADGGIPEQQNQIESMIENGAKVIVVEPSSSLGLEKQLAAAKAAGIIIIAFDQLITATPDVDLLVAFDNCQIGRQQATALLEGLAEKGSPPWNIELVAGDPNEEKVQTMYQCAMAVLQPFIDDGTLIIPSGEIAIEEISILKRAPKDVHTRFDLLLSQYYSDGIRLDGILAPYDIFARAAITSVEDAGLPRPIVVGADSEVESVQWIAEGRQYATISKDMNVLIPEVIKIIQMLQQGHDFTKDGLPVINNGVVDVPAHLLEPLLVTQDNLCTAYLLNTAAGEAAADTSFCKG